MLVGLAGRKLAGALFALEAVVVGVLFAAKVFDGQDLEVYLGGARLLVESGDPYGTWVQTHGGWLPFTYTPFAAAVFLPGTLLSAALATRVVGLASIIAGGIVVYLFVATLNGSLTDRSAVRGRAIAVLAAIGAQAVGGIMEPVRSTLGFGQINTLLMLSVVLDALLPGRARTKGLLIGVAAAIKLTPAFFILFFLFRKDFRSAARVVAGFLGAGALMFLAAPDASAKFWTTILFDTGRIGDRGYVGNQSLRGLLARFGLGSAEDVVWVPAALVVVALTAFVIVRVAEPVFALTACALGGLLASPVSWTHHWIWCVPVLVLLIRTRTIVSAALAAGTVALFVIAPMWLAPRPAGSFGWWLATESYVLYGLLLLTLAAVCHKSVKASSMDFNPRSGAQRPR
ncbi:glycosyltransferase 87 family protein [Amycolatopsis sp. QT-25]|uniref:glycosyltransferase 87 family protein n=1 Tax=Amycolatopsis sp. QT-25 TaxID=3034022 RepID=UPI0023ECF030|nr:glycosyltransferase 87 family protein [Amycolatopsis sp. QT-25]WET78820.1 glycosyltransferase 87 family protein [Amycolatopsis sp. QT-25]